MSQVYSGPRLSAGVLDSSQNVMQGKQSGVSRGIEACLRTGLDCKGTISKPPKSHGAILWTAFSPCVLLIQLKMQVLSLMEAGLRNAMQHFGQPEIPV
ncbi:hypothetical protein CFIMG_004406RA [Ceratocystis fimbriata CBS 114723]|uniref:Uncharacterized protein n=1 Tax=Ceratocystis fimbriata CBS 114723 TaxID=1035309 RepID=A0A2C5WYT9_9PEZI|nr:hypothetical protein CFIMG_004406RA [Ceratocystis fimbriata CBS 114723]